jgi:UDP-2-acetamido-2-deoxy-ribo-hexuluronate aminotransferase
MIIKFFNPSKSYKKIRKIILKEIDRVLLAGDLILRKDLEVFENNLAKFVGTKYAVGVSNGTDALMMCMKYLKAKRVQVPYYTFKSTLSAVLQAGAKYSFNDERVQIIAHLEGLRLKIPKGKTVIEDACQALGAIKNPKTFAQCWSFYPAKILGAYGDAGAITTNDKKFYEWAKGYRNHFKETNEDWGGNHRMDNLQATILNVKMKYLKGLIARRQEIAKMYDETLNSIILTPINQKGRVYQDYVIEVDGNKQRDELYEFLKANGIETMKNEYPFPIKKPDKMEKQGLRLPCNENLTNEEIRYVIKRVNEFYKSV